MCRCCVRESEEVGRRKIEGESDKELCGYDVDTEEEIVEQEKERSKRNF